MRFYTYMHRRVSDGAVFYIGKGSGKRFGSHKSRSAAWNRVSIEHGVSASIIASWSSEEDAYQHESFLIACFRDLGAPLVNDIGGGRGGINEIRHRPGVENRRVEAIRTASVSLEYRARKRAISIAVGNTPPVTLGADHPRSRAVRCIEWNHVFVSAQEAEKWLRTHSHEKASKSAIVACCRGRQKSAYEFRWEYA